MSEESSPPSCDNSLPDDLTDDDAPDFFRTIPEEFRSLGLEHTDEEREEYLVRLAEGIWPGGTDEEQGHIIAWHRDVARACGLERNRLCGHTPARHRRRPRQHRAPDRALRAHRGE